MNMINNLFSTFDPSSSYISFSWVILSIPILIILININKRPNKKNKSIKIILTKIRKEISHLNQRKKKISRIIITKIFFIVLSFNIAALIPFNFTPTAHISVSLHISLTMWASRILYGWINSFKHIISHITPLGTPNKLINFIVIIEIVRNLIRPITLSVRLSANIVAGHLLISLLSNFSITTNSKTSISLIVIIMLASLEIIVAIVQSYVIATLITLYQRERIK